MANSTFIASAELVELFNTSGKNRAIARGVYAAHVGGASYADIAQSVSFARAAKRYPVIMAGSEDESVESVELRKAERLELVTVAAGLKGSLNVSKSTVANHGLLYGSFIDGTFTPGLITVDLYDRAYTTFSIAAGRKSTLALIKSAADQAKDGRAGWLENRLAELLASLTMARKAANDDKVSADKAAASTANADALAAADQAGDVEQITLADVLATIRAIGAIDWSADDLNAIRAELEAQALSPVLV